MQDHLWYAVTVRNGEERRARAAIFDHARTMGVQGDIPEIRIPVEPVVELRATGRKTARKFFPGMLLVRMVLNDTLRTLILRTPAVTGFLGGDHPAELTEADVIRLAGKVVRSAETCAAGDKVRVIEGPFADQEGVVEQVDGEMLRVAVSLYGRVTPVELSADMVTKLVE